jgi:hypothetical protein
MTAYWRRSPPSFADQPASRQGGAEPKEGRHRQFEAGSVARRGGVLGRPTPSGRATVVSMSPFYGGRRGDSGGEARCRQWKGKGRGRRREVRGRRPARDQGARGGMGGLSGDEADG